jgi:hypothetical protein
LYPVVEGKAVRQSDQSVAADIAEIAERIEEDDGKRQQIN